MYSVDKLDTVVLLTNVPSQDINAPLPTVIADDFRLVLEYLMPMEDPNWDGTNVDIVTTDPKGSVALIRFQRPFAHMMGAPNEEAISGHPLADRGVEAFAAFEVKQSSWIRTLERMSSLHPYHDRNRFLQSKRHFIFAFHDSTFECIANGFDVSIVNGSILDSVQTTLDDMFRQDPV